MCLMSWLIVSLSSRDSLDFEGFSRQEPAQLLPLQRLSPLQLHGGAYEQVLLAGEDFPHPIVGLLHNSPDLLVDEPGGFLTEPSLLRQADTPQEQSLLPIFEGQRAQTL